MLFHPLRSKTQEGTVIGGNDTDVGLKIDSLVASATNN